MMPRSTKSKPSKAPAAAATETREDVVAFLAVMLLFVTVVTVQYRIFLGLEATPRTLFLPMVMATIMASIVAMLRRSRADLKIERDAHQGARARIEELNRNLEIKVESQSARIDAYEGKLASAQRRGNLGLVAAGSIHDINNAIMIAHTSLDALALEDTHAAREDLRAARAAVNQIVELSSSFRGVVHPSTRSNNTNPRAAILRLLPSLRRVSGESVALETDLPSSTSSLLVSPSESAFGQVVLNLVVNARDALDGAQGTIRVRLRVVDDHHAEVVVEDSGTGIPEAIRSKIFDPFFSTKPVDIGSGLGLHVLHRIVTEAGGRVEVRESDLGGASFGILLPTLATTDPSTTADARA